MCADTAISGSASGLAKVSYTGSSCQVDSSTPLGGLLRRSGAEDTNNFYQPKQVGLGVFDIVGLCLGPRLF